jgi:hypothetical protein
MLTIIGQSWKTLAALENGLPILQKIVSDVLRHVESREPR